MIYIYTPFLRLFSIIKSCFKQKKIQYQALIIISAVFILNSCKKNDLIPSYIHIDNIVLNSTYETDGSNSNKITDAWVYLDDDLIGIYELPATFPVLATGSHKISIRAGIKINGISMSRGYYPFYQAFSTTVDLQEKEVDTIIPVVTYYPDKIKWKEDFEEGGITLVKYGSSDTSFFKTTDDVFEGSFSAVARLTSDKDYLLCVSSGMYDIPQTQSPVFLELNYKTDTEVIIGMFGKLPSGVNDKVETLILNPTDTWKKIYINLTFTANYTVNTTDFRVYFESYLPEGQSSSNIYIDNIKLLYN